jgi:hypothetical protein
LTSVGSGIHMLLTGRGRRETHTCLLSILRDSINSLPSAYLLKSQMIVVVLGGI